MEHEHAAFTPAEGGGTLVYLAVDGQYAGVIRIEDAPKPGAAQALKDLKHEGVEKLVMLTGDAPEAARTVADRLGIDEVHAGLLPADKVTQVERLLGEKKELPVASLSMPAYNPPTPNRQLVGDLVYVRVAVGALAEA